MDIDLVNQPTLSLQNSLLPRMDLLVAAIRRAAIPIIIAWINTAKSESKRLHANANPSAIATRQPIYLTLADAKPPGVSPTRPHCYYFFDGCNFPPIHPYSPLTDNPKKQPGNQVSR